MAVPKLRLEELKKLGPEEVVVVGVGSRVVDLNQPLEVRVSDEERRCAKERLQAAGFFHQTRESETQLQQQPRTAKALAKEEMSERNRTHLHKLMMME